MKEIVKAFLKNEKGTETVEWAIMVGIIAVASITALVLIGSWVLDQFNVLDNNLAGVPAP